MAIAFGTQGTTPSGTTASITGSTSVTPALPASLANGDMVLIVVSNKADTVSPTTPAGWNLGATSAGGAGASGNNSGATRTTVFYREKDASWSTMPAITVTSGNSTIAQAFRYTKASNMVWDLAFAIGANSTNTASYSATATSNPGFTAGDLAFVAISLGDDAPTYSAEVITATGVSAWGTMTERAEGRTTTGNDISNVIFDRPVTTGTSTANPVVTATISVATQSGPMVIARLREVAPPVQVSSSDGGSIAVSETSKKVDGVWNPGGSTPLNIAVIHDSPTPTASDLSIQTYLQNAGHNATMEVENATTAVSDTTYDVVVISESGSATAVDPYVNWAGGVVCFETAWNTLGLSTVAAGAPGSSDTQAALTSHPINNGTSSPLTWFASAQSIYGVTSGSFSDNPSQVQAVANHPLVTSFSQVVALEKNMPDVNGEVHPGRRVGAGLISTRPGSLNTAGQAYMVKMVEWAGEYSTGSWTFPDSTPITASDTGSIAVSESASVTIVDSKTASDTAAVSVAESISLTKNNTVTDSAAVSVAETSSLAKFTTKTDTAAISVAETAAIFSARTASDTGSLAVAETGTFFKTLSSTDGAAISITEVVTAGQGAYTGTELWKGWQRYSDHGYTAGDWVDSDPYPDGMNNAHTNYVITASDGGSLAVSETRANAVVLTASDSVAITITENRNVTSTLLGVDTTNIVAAEQASVFKTSTGTDGGGIGVSETSSRFITLVSNDSAAISVSETTIATKQITSTDGAAIAATEGTYGWQSPEDWEEGQPWYGPKIMLVSTDGAAISVSESQTRLVSKSSTDGGSIAVQEDGDAYIPKVATDSASIAVSESGTIFKSISVSDTGGLRINEVANTQGTQPGADNFAIGVTESRSLVVQFSSTDTSGLRITDSSDSYVPKTATDGAAISVAETQQSTSTLSKTDGASIALSEGKSFFNNVTSSDGAAISATEIRSVGGTSLGTEIMGLGVTETGVLLVTSTKTDGAAVGIEEDKLLLVPRTATDQASIGINDIGERVQLGWPIEVYHNYQWRRAIIFVYHDGDFMRAPLNAYVNAEWRNEQEDTRQ